MKNIYIIGAQSTGKTTLVNALESCMRADPDRHGYEGPLVIREVARTVLEDKNFTRGDITTSPKRTLLLQQHILAAQYEAENIACSSLAPTWYICDRSGLGPIVYARCFAGEEAATEMLASAVWLQLEDRMKKGIAMLCELAVFGL
jgi:nicotinamide riboside kinase